MPQTCAKLREFLGLDAKPEWKVVNVKPGVDLTKVSALFERIK